MSEIYESARVLSEIPTHVYVIGGLAITTIAVVAAYVGTRTAKTFHNALSGRHPQLDERKKPSPLETQTQKKE